MDTIRYVLGVGWQGRNCIWIVVWTQALLKGGLPPQEDRNEKGTRLADSWELSRHSKHHNTETLQSVIRAAHRNKEGSTQEKWIQEWCPPHSVVNSERHSAPHP